MQNDSPDPLAFMVNAPNISAAQWGHHETHQAAQNTKFHISPHILEDILEGGKIVAKTQEP